MFNILNHKESTNQNIIEILPHANQSGYHQENKKLCAEFQFIILPA
jgi:hypothetical protein